MERTHSTHPLSLLFVLFGSQGSPLLIVVLMFASNPFNLCPFSTLFVCFSFLSFFCSSHKSYQGGSSLDWCPNVCVQPIQLVPFFFEKPFNSSLVFSSSFFALPMEDGRAASSSSCCCFKVGIQPIQLIPLFENTFNSYPFLRGHSTRPPFWEPIQLVPIFENPFNSSPFSPLFVCFSALPMEAGRAAPPQIAVLMFAWAAAAFPLISPSTRLNKEIIWGVRPLSIIPLLNSHNFAAFMQNVAKFSLLLYSIKEPDLHIACWPVSQLSAIATPSSVLN